MLLAYNILFKFHSVLLFISDEPQQKKDTLLSVEPGLLIWTIIIFFLLLLLLKKYAWGPILSSLDEREKSIKGSIEKAEQLKQESEKLLAQNRELLQKADLEARKTINEGKELAEKLKTEIISKTHED